jgi:hypothetical protein
VHGIDEEAEDGVDIDELEPGAHGVITDQRIRQTADERSPLLARAPTGPPVTVSRRSKKRPSIDTSSPLTPRGTPSPRIPPRRRRMTISQEADEIWDELNDRENVLSPIRRSDEVERRRRSGTLPARRKGSSSSWLNQMRRSSWWDRSAGSERRASGTASGGKGPVDAAASLLRTPDSDGHQSDTEGEQHPEMHRNRGSWGPGNSGTAKGREGVGDWFKLKWWPRKGRKDQDSEHSPHDEERGVGGAT